MIFLINAIVLGLLAYSSTGLQAPAKDAPANTRAQVLADFTKRVDDYVSLRKKLDDDTPPLKKTEEPADIRVAQQSLAERIKVARANAKQGDLFTPAVAVELKRLMRPEVTDKGTKELMKDDKPQDVPFKVNAEYPDKQPLATSPPNVLANLPTLPKDIEYRFVGKHVILRDSRANLILDYMLNAIP